jgi:hypothetical protein
MTGGIVHKPMFERLILSEYAVADLTFANANVFYELGVRHAVRPYSTALIFASDTRLPFDVALDRGLPYPLDAAGAPTDLEPTRRRLTERLEAARDASVDSPLFQLVEGFPEIDRLKTDVFRDQVRYSAAWKERLADARASGIEAVRTAERELDDLRDVEAGILIDLFLSYRAVKGYEEMVALVDQMPRPLATTPLVREQLGLALNRLNRRNEAERVLLALIKERGPSSETYGILGRVYKDHWRDALGRGTTSWPRACSSRRSTRISPGSRPIGAMPIPGSTRSPSWRCAPRPIRDASGCFPVVTYAVDRRLASGQADYWDHATRLELAVLAKDEAGARQSLRSALAAVRESWEAESTCEQPPTHPGGQAQAERGRAVGRHAEQELHRRAATFQPSPAENRR